MRYELIIGVILLAASGAACGVIKSAPTPIPASELTRILTATPTPTPSLTPSGGSAPPLATLVIAGKEQIAGLGSFCWRKENGAPFCSDTIGIPTAQEALPADSPFAARLRLVVEPPVTESQLSVRPVTVDDQVDSEARGLRWWRPKGEVREQFTLTLEDESIVELSLEPGLYVLSLFVRWQGWGDASYGFLVEVQ